MTYRTNHLLSQAQNILGLVNSAARYPFLPGEFSISQPLSVTSNAGNGFANTRATITALPGARILGSTDIFWNRVSINANVAGLNATTGTIFIGTGWTVEQIKDEICKRYRLIKEEMNWTATPNPPTVPGSSVLYTLQPAANMYFFVGGILQITVQNAGFAPPIGPEYHFPPSYEVAGGHNGLRAFRIPNTAPTSFVSYKQNGDQNFVRLLNLHNSKPGEPLTPDMFELGEVVPGTYGTSNAVVLVTPTAKSRLVDPFYIFYIRTTWSPANFNTTSGNLVLRTKVDKDLFNAWLMVMNRIPYDEVVFSRVVGKISTGANRTLYIRNDHIDNPRIYTRAVGEGALTVSY